MPLLPDSSSLFALYDLMPDAGFITDAKGMILHWNHEASQLTGYSREDTVGKNILDLLRPFPDGNFFIGSKEDLSKGLTWVSEFVLNKADGTQVYIQGKRSCLFSDNGEMTAVLGVMSDITEKIALRARLQEAETRWKGYYESSPDPIFILGRDCSILEMNEACCEFCGYSAAELRSMVLDDILSQDQLSDKGLICEKFRTERKVSGLYVIRHKTGNRRWCRLDSVMLNEGRILCFGKDITSDFLYREKLEQLEREYNSFFTYSQDGFYFMKHDIPLKWEETILTDELLDYIIHNSIVERCNPALEAQYGAKPGGLNGMPLIRFFQHDPWRLKQFVREGFTNGFIQVTADLRRIDGTSFWVEGHYVLLKDEMGRVIGHFGVQRDITHRMEIETELRDAKQRLEMAVSSAHIGLWDQNFVKGEVIRNSYWAEMLGYSIDEIPSHLNAFLEMVHPDDIKEVKKAIQEHESGITDLYRVEHRMKTRDGGYKWILNIGRITSRSPEGKPLRAMGVHIDIDAFKAIEKALIESKETYQGIINSASDAIYIHDSEGVFLDVNQAAEKMYGYPMEFFIGKTPAVLSAEGYNDMELLFSYMKEALEGTPQRFEFWGKKADGTVFPKEVTLSPSSYLGKRCIIAVARDITQQKEEARRLQKLNQDLVDANNEKDRLFSILGHDLRSPFSSFLGLTELMATELHTMTLDEIRKIATTMQVSATNLYRLIDNLLEWSKIRRDLTDYYPDRLPLDQVVATVFELHHEQAEAKGISLLNSVEHGFCVFADEKMLETILRNLVSNAIKFTTRGGFINISSVNREEGFAEIRVKDTGIGIPSEIIPYLFGIHDGTNRRGTSGEPTSGLGLPLCKEFVEKHGGKIWVDSIEGKGSRFYFTLPHCNHPEK